MSQKSVHGREAGYFPGSCTGLIHVIEQGDTLYDLSRRYHVSVSAIMFENPYLNIYNLRVGDELCIPVGRPERKRQPGAAAGENGAGLR